jgi:hypothetical protein
LYLRRFSDKLLVECVSFNRCESVLDHFGYRRIRVRARAVLDDWRTLGMNTSWKGDRMQQSKGALTLGAMAMVWASAGVGRADVVYDSFGGGTGYSSSSWNDVAGPSAAIANPRSPAFPFTPASSFNFTLAELPLEHELGINHYTVSLRADQAGLPGAVLESFDLTNLPSYSSPGLTDVISASHPLLVAGQKYWLAAMPVSSTAMGLWAMRSPAVGGNKALTPDLGQTWTLNEFGFQTMSPMRIEGTPAPEPAGLAVLAVGGLLMGRWRRR